MNENRWRQFSVCMGTNQSETETDHAKTKLFRMHVYLFTVSCFPLLIRYKYELRQQKTAAIAKLVERQLAERKVVVRIPAHHTKGVKNGTSTPLADACIKGVVIGK